jgi:hypothetical protein
MNTELTRVSFTSAVMVDKDYVYMASSFDVLEESAPFARVFIYNGSHPAMPWPHHHNLEWRNIGLALFFDEDGSKWFCALSEEGNIEFITNGSRTFHEKIPGTGVFAEDAEGWGYLNCLKQIPFRKPGSHLYACGYNGQVYKREGANRWAHMDDGLLQPRNNRQNELDLLDIGGPDESAIYTVGSVSVGGYSPKGSPAVAFFWNGRHWRKLALPEDSRSLGGILVESESRVWLCGDGGTLLLGNAQDGFRRVSSPEDRQHFYSMTRFAGQLWLGSDQGLFIHDPENPDSGIQPAKPCLNPPLHDTHIVDSWDGVLWSIGRKDIARFDGKTWERIDHPDNPPIR